MNKAGNMEELLGSAKKREWIVHYPLELDNDGTVCEIFGFRHEETKRFNILPAGNASAGVERIGIIRDGVSGDTEETDRLVALRRDGELEFRYEGKACKKQPYGLIQEIFSRNAGILETRTMLNKKVVIVGAGSVGSLAAAELARSGVGGIMLIDSDILEYHNLCRHQCDMRDVGKRKTDAVAEKVKRINPELRVETFCGFIEDAPQKLFDGFIAEGDTVFLGGGDNRASDRYINRLAQLYKIPFVSIGLWTRAAAGEVFYHIPGETPCYHCAYGDDNDVSGRVNASHRFYIDEEDDKNLSFEPGISIDINFVTNIGLKIALALLNRKETRSPLLDYLKPLTLICNNNDPAAGGKEVEIFAHPLQITSSIAVERRAECPVCGESKE